jgi:plasmid stabilization system protein ParE
MRHSVRFHPAARGEAIEIVDFLAKSASPEIALAWFASLEGAIEALATMPRRHPIAREAPSFPGVDLRQVLVGSYRVIFVVGPRSVDVLHVRHAARLGFDEAPADPADQP